MRTTRARNDIESSAPIFDALGDPTRLRLVARLSRGGPQSITGLTRGSTLTRQAITKHLKVLAGAGIVRGKRRGRESRWALKRDQLDVATRYLEWISKRWDSALSRLKTFVEE